MDIQIEEAPARWHEAIRRVVQEALRFPRRGRSSSRRLNAPGGTLSIAFVSDEQIASINQRWLAHEGPTDVITFDLRDDPADAILDGELIISIDTVRREARRRGHAPRDESLLYVAHGVLHLLGHDDATPAQSRRMHRLEDHILARAGAVPVYRQTRRVHPDMPRKRPR